MKQARALRLYGTASGVAVLAAVIGSALIAQRTLGAGFLPHGYCFTWIPGLLWLHVVSDSSIVLAYLTIPMTLLYVVKHRSDLPFGWMFLLFASFIIACGATHAFEVWTIWNADYWLAGIVKAFTAAVSVSTAIALVLLVPRALAIPSAAQLRSANEALRLEIDGRVAAERQLRESRHQFERLVETAPDAMVVVDPRGRIVLVNLEAERQFGYGRDELVGKQVEQIVPEGFTEAMGGDAPSQAEAQMKRDGAGIELSARRKDGSDFPVEILFSPLDSADGVMVTASIRNISVRKAADALEEALFAERERAEVTLKSIGDAVVCRDILGKITFLNLVAEKMTGWSLGEAEGMPMTDVLRIVDATTGSAVDASTNIAADPGVAAPLPVSVLVRRDGLEIAIEASFALIRDRDGKATGAVVVFRDVSVARAMRLQITHSAQHDFLTGLPNRLLLNDRVGQAIASARRTRTCLAVVFLDLDGFKHINDSLGHPVGDSILRSVARRLTDCVRGADTVSRLGGDEFVVLLTEVRSAEDAATSANRMLQAVARVHAIDHHDLFVTTSVGVSIFPDDGADADALIKNADTAMYRAKTNRPNSYRFFKAEMNVEAVERQSIEESLRRAMERNELALHYQPKIDLATGRIIGAEALLRWTPHTLGPISPARFIPIAEDCGLIVPIGHWVLREACLQCVAWGKAGLPAFTMAINVSALQLRDDAFLDGVCAVIEETGMDSHRLELELTESVLMKNAGPTVSTLQALRPLGIRLAIDDFGTGYSSLSYLHRLPIDTLKIDQSFIHQISTPPIESRIVKAIISMAKSLGLCVIAEGVETREQLAFLQANGCDEVQGYLTGRPVAAEQFARVLESGVSAAFKAGGAQSDILHATSFGRS